MNLWIVTPCHGREALTAVCLEQRRRLTQALRPQLDVTTLVIACDSNLDTAKRLRMPTLERPNQLGLRVNDGLSHAAEHGADLLMLAGSDDWIHPSYLTSLPRDPGIVHTTRRAAVVNETGTLIAYLHVTYPGGEGLRVWPRHLLQPLDYRPVQENRERAIDTGILTAVEAASGPTRWNYHPGHDHTIVDFKTTANLNSYQAVVRAYALTEQPDPFGRLRRHYPGDLVDQIETVYARQAEQP